MTVLASYTPTETDKIIQVSTFIGAEYTKHGMSAGNIIQHLAILLGNGHLKDLSLYLNQ